MKYICSGQKLLGKCLIPLQPLLSSCELAVSSPILTEGRREAGGSVELAIRLRKPISSDEVVMTEVPNTIIPWPIICDCLSGLFVWLLMLVVLMLRAVSSFTAYKCVDINGHSAGCRVAIYAMYWCNRRCEWVRHTFWTELPLDSSGAWPFCLCFS